MALRDRVWLSPAEYRRRTLLVWLGLALPVVLAVGFAWQRLSGPSPGHVQVYDAATHRKLWSRTTDGGYVVVLAVTPAAALVADADDCIHGGTGTVEILTPGKTIPVTSVAGCAVYRFVSAYGIYARRAGSNPGRLVVTLPSQLGRGTASLPCPCPASAPAPNGAADAPVSRGAYAEVQLGKFTLGAD